MKKPLLRIQRFLALALVTIALPLMAETDPADNTRGGRAMVMTVQAVVTDIDLETRQVSLQTPNGEIVTITAKENVVKLEDVAVGDVLHATYLTALEGELREPTEEELAEPWVVLEDSGAGVVEGIPAAGAARLIRAVCTIEGMNRLLGTVTLLDSNGRAHVIADVEPAKMEGVTLGQTIVVIYREALALSLEHVEKAAAED